MTKKAISQQAAQRIGSLINTLSCAESIVKEECAKNWRHHDHEKSQHWMQIHREAANELKEKFGIMVITYRR